MIKNRPLALIGYGGYPAAAPTLAAWLLRIPVWLHEQNAVMGRTNQMLSRLVNGIFTSWPETKGLPQQVKTEYTGLPVRTVFAGIPDYKPSAETKPLTLAVFGGSLGARLFAEIIPAAVCRLQSKTKRRLRITQQAHVDQSARLQEIYADQTISADIRPFFSDVAAVMSAADLIIARAGASTVAELAAAGRPSVLIPFARALDNHQLANANQLAAAGGTEIVTEQDASPDHLAAVIDRLLTTPDWRGEYARCPHNRPGGRRRTDVQDNRNPSFFPSQEAA